MALNSTNIPIAVDRKTKLDLSCDHDTTMDFMRLQPVYYRHMIKGEHLNFSCLASVLPGPIEVPLFGRMRLNLRGFFIPYRLCFPNWESFYNDNIASNIDASSLVDSPPTVSASVIHEMFMDSNFALTTLVPVPSPATTEYIADFYLQDSDVSNPYHVLGYNYTTTGRELLKLLQCLGYTHILPDTKDTFYVDFNALGLLAFAKAYIDWFANQQYLNHADLLAVERLLKYNDPSSNLRIDPGQLYLILCLFRYVCYDSDGYFINAWDNPVTPNSAQFSSFSIVDNTVGNPAVNASVASDSAFGTPVMVQTASSNLGVGTEYIHKVLRKLTEYQKRHALSGARSIDRALAQYGFISDALRQERTIYVGSQSIDINVGQIYATASGSDGTTTSNVGDFAGRAVGQGSKQWDYQCDEAGIFIVTASILPSGGYFQGYDRNNRHLNKLDFFVPEFDTLGVQVIEKGELYISNNQGFQTTEYDKAFGFTGRYGEYKRPISFVTGDLRLLAHYRGASSWHLMRMFDDSSFVNSGGMVHSLNFTRGIDFRQYNRIFQNTDNAFDKFYVSFHFDVGTYAPCRSLTETFEFEDAGKSITTNSNGAALN